MQLKEQKELQLCRYFSWGKVVEVLEAELGHRQQPRPAGEVREWEIEGKLFKLGASLGQELQDQITGVIAEHLDAFAWSSADMLGIDPDFLCHSLTMDNRVRPIVYRRRKFNEERHLIIKMETQKLLNVDHIREIQYHEWLANVVLVQKANGKWRMCVDFIDMNKACPKDSYPLPNINSLVDNASGCRLLSFLNAFSGDN